jgi:hypothetical protein
MQVNRTARHCLYRSTSGTRHPALAHDRRGHEHSSVAIQAILALQ